MLLQELVGEVILVHGLEALEGVADGLARVRVLPELHDGLPGLRNELTAHLGLELVKPGDLHLSLHQGVHAKPLDGLGELPLHILANFKLLPKAGDLGAELSELHLPPLLLSVELPDARRELLEGVAANPDAGLGLDHGDHGLLAGLVGLERANNLAVELGNVSLDAKLPDEVLGVLDKTYYGLHASAHGEGNVGGGLLELLDAVLTQVLSVSGLVGELVRDLGAEGGVGG
mmetsp:Transcript_1872/g.3732  ORF Transcript_1872/g.3732 Transcript_1872/m.3732 type:complete len:231 (-) Transcript_1872:546-1238(-)